MGGVFALDYGAALALGHAMEADMALLADVLPAVEGALVRRANGEGVDSGGMEEDEQTAI